MPTLPARYAPFASARYTRLRQDAPQPQRRGRIGSRGELPRDCGLHQRSGSRPEADLRRLWRRIVFSIAVANTDDHLRNHGFLLDGKGWRLSPAYDLDPSPDPAGLSLAIDEHDDNSLNFGLALSVARFFRLTKQDAQSILDSVRVTVATSRERATRMGIARSEIDRMEGAFSNRRGWMRDFSLTRLVGRNRSKTE